MSGKEKTNGSLAMAPRVITIPAASQENTRKLRVAAYARVSSNSEDQKHSFAAQNAYYSKLITGNPDWELADIYADQGITGTSIDKRDDFLRMMEDCRKGRIDRILVKSSSRFARNTKESLEAVRELAALGVSVYFEEQNIDTAQVSGEVLIAMFAALAQRESEAIRPCWGTKKDLTERWWSTQSRQRLSERFTSCTYPVRRCAISRKPWKQADSRIRQERRNGQPPICGRSSLMKNTAVTSCSRRPSFETASASRSFEIPDSCLCI